MIDQFALVLLLLLSFVMFSEPLRVGSLKRMFIIFHKRSASDSKKYSDDFNVFFR